MSPPAIAGLRRLSGSRSKGIAAGISGSISLEVVTCMSSPPVGPAPEFPYHQSHSVHPARPDQFGPAAHVGIVAAMQEIWTEGLSVLGRRILGDQDKGENWGSTTACTRGISFATATSNYVASWSG